jgi:Icc protein
MRVLGSQGSRLNSNDIYSRHRIFQRDTGVRDGAFLATPFKPRPACARFYSRRRFPPFFWNIRRPGRVDTGVGGASGTLRLADRIEKENGMSDYIEENLDRDGVDRRGFLKCMAWAGTGTLCLLQGGVLKSFALSDVLQQKIGHMKSDLSFVQISDSHIGFNKDANPDVTATLREAIAKVNALPTPPAFVLHTGDLTQLSKADEFDTLSESLKSLRTERIFYVPGEHDVLNDNGDMFRERFGQGTQGDGWYSFDKNGAHFIGLVNVLNLKAGGLGYLGPDQLAWLQKDVSRLKSSTPIVVFAHIPLWAVYPQWGWGTDDSEQALSYLKRFASVTVLNGHIHQTMQKVEGNITFHTACSTAFPQPAPGQAAGPGPMKVPAEKLRSVLGITDVNFVRGKHTLGIVDSGLS